MKKKWYKVAVTFIWAIPVILLAGLSFYIYTVSIDLGGLYGAMPDTREVENPESDLSSELISADGVSLGRYFRFNRSQVTFDELSTDLVNTLLLSEDHRFYDHSGLDFKAYLRVIWGLISFNPAGGGSTITQQLAKNLYTRNIHKKLDGKIAKMGRYPKRIVQKTKEWMIAVDLERGFTKKEIIAMYLNTAEFSNNSYGIKVATETYFNKKTSELTLQESAMLIGMLQNPTYYNPIRRPENALKKRNEVMYKVHKHRYKIKSKEQYDSISRLPLGLKFEIQNQNQGLATYFRTVIRNDLIRFCNSQGIDLWNSGLKIYTTIDSRIQKYAEEALVEHMKVLQQKFDEQWGGRNPWRGDDYRELKGFLRSRIRRTEPYKNLVTKHGKDSSAINAELHLKRPMRVFTWDGEKDTVFSYMDSLKHYKRFLQAGMMAMDPLTGSIKAWVGGIDHTYFKYDHVKQGTRQPGSTFKPFVYGLAIESGYSPCHVMKDVSPSFKVPGGVWWPPNANGQRGTGEEMTIRQALARSVNSITAQMMQALGAENVIEFAHRLGIKSKLDPVPSLCLGTSDVSLYEMVGAYSSFVNKGIYTEPFYIVRIENKNGNIIRNFIPKTRQAMSKETAYKMLYMLMGGIEEVGGSSRGLSREVKIDNEIGGKTGTTNNASDGWYMGLTHNLVAGVWVGGDERSIHFPSWFFGQGSRTARPIWDKFMQKVYANPSLGITKGQFEEPSAGLRAKLNCRVVDSQVDSTMIKTQPWNIDN